MVVVALCQEALYQPLATVLMQGLTRAQASGRDDMEGPMRLWGDKKLNTKGAKLLCGLWLVTVLCVCMMCLEQLIQLIANMSWKKWKWGSKMQTSKTEHALRLPAIIKNPKLTGYCQNSKPCSRDNWKPSTSSSTGGRTGRKDTSRITTCFQWLHILQANALVVI